MSPLIVIFFFFCRQNGCITLLEEHFPQFPIDFIRIVENAIVGHQSRELAKHGGTNQSFHSEALT